MGKLKVITKEVKLKEFNRRGCSACGDRLVVDSYNGRVHGKYGHSSGKILICDSCQIGYYYDWVWTEPPGQRKTWKEGKYIIDKIIFNFPNSHIDAFIDYSGEMRERFPHTEGPSKYNVFLRFTDPRIGGTLKYLYFAKTYSLPKRKILKQIKDKVETYMVFS